MGTVIWWQNTFFCLACLAIMLTCRHWLLKWQRQRTMYITRMEKFMRSWFMHRESIDSESSKSETFKRNCFIFGRKTNTFTPDTVSQTNTHIPTDSEYFGYFGSEHLNCLRLCGRNARYSQIYIFFVNKMPSSSTIASICWWVRECVSAMGWFLFSFTRSVGMCTEKVKISFNGAVIKIEWREFVHVAAIEKTFKALCKIET